eukprot:COSAG01_NODE_21114_length_917_cov_1.370416_1_plen_83_part_00
MAGSSSSSQKRQPLAWLRWQRSSTDVRYMYGRKPGGPCLKKLGFCPIAAWLQTRAEAGGAGAHVTVATGPVGPPWGFSSYAL